MTTLIELLLRQSDVGGGRIAGDQLSAHDGPALERLLDAGILEERESVEDWPVCQDCDCGADARPILDRGGELRAICPAGRSRDLALDEQDIRRFIISDRRLSLELLGGDASVVSEPMPGLWYRRGDGGRSLFLTLRRSVCENLQLLHVLRFYCARLPDDSCRAGDVCAKRASPFCSGGVGGYPNHERDLDEFARRGVPSDSPDFDPSLGFHAALESLCS